ncbi:pirin family protein [Thalassotalea ponticola]|uniref:pirin family protein n=1 Tax=Thalassotalea ponticola TaxID=1523392 RepID=UPI0025B445AE|nr:pirin-like bicupin family protein [Thalassotalea ponticola]MDN3653738.1 pirin family protein [Thalassotalea ponticola]
MQYIRLSEERGHVDFSWLQSKHSFSFGHYYDPKHMGVSVLRVINDDIVAPGAGFGAHGHRDMEIISYVLSGSLEHQDSTGNRYKITAGEVQRMSAGSGIMHSEYNGSKTEPVNFLQIWIQPKHKGRKPSYQQKYIKQQGVLTPLVSETGVADSLTLDQDVLLSRLVLTKGDDYRLHDQHYVTYVHIIEGQAEIAERQFKAGDGFALAPNEAVNISAQSDFQALHFLLPND